LSRCEHRGKERGSGNQPAFQAARAQLKSGACGAITATEAVDDPGTHVECLVAEVQRLQSKPTALISCATN
jgi:hypothetical protein